MEFTIDELTALTLTHGRRADHARKAAAELLKVAEESDKAAQIYLEAGKRIGREKEEKESKVKIRSIITSMLVLVLVGVFLMSSLTLAEDVTPAAGETAAVTASVNGNPVEATLEPVGQPSNGDSTTNALNTVLDKLIIIVAIIGVVVLAFKTAGLVPKETFDSSLEKGFALAKELVAMTPTPLDDAALDLIKPGLTKWLEDELARRQGLQNTLQINTPTSNSSTVTTPITQTFT